MTITEPGKRPVLCFFGLLLACLLTLPIPGFGAEGCENRTFRAGQPLKYCGELPSLAVVNIRNAVLDEVVAGLDKPWAMEFLSDSELLVTEIGGGIKRVNLQTGEIRSVEGGPKVPGGAKQVGLLDVALHPDFANNGRIYLSHSVKGDGESDRGFSIAVSRGVLTAEGIEGVEQIHVARPFAPAPAQFGGALEFDDEGYLYFATGDRGTKGPAQDPTNTIGKLLRLTEDGAIPPDNPAVGNPNMHDAVYSWGLRNPQGLRFDAVTGVLYETEHGPMGGDEINVLEPGKNYGWPTVSYGAFYNTEEMGVGTAMPGMEEPLWFYLPSIAVSPIEVYRGSMFPEWDGYLMVGALKARHVNMLAVKGGRVLSEQRILDEIEGRIRDIKVAGDGSVYVLVHNGGRVMRLWRNPEDSGMDQRVDRSGGRVYGYICVSCHNRAGNSAPQLSDAGYWLPRLQQPLEGLYRAAIEGRGDMPAMGLCDNCSEKEIREAVDVLLWQVRNALGEQVGE